MSDPSGPGHGAGWPPALPERDVGFARERTALAWSRTGLGFAGGGAVLLRLFAGADVGVAPLWLSVALVGLGAVAWAWRWHAARPAPAIDTPLGRAAARTLAVGLALVVVAAVAVET